MPPSAAWNRGLLGYPGILFLRKKRSCSSVENGVVIERHSNYIGDMPHSANGQPSNFW